MPATCQESDSWTCAAVYDWTGNETLATERHLADRQATGHPRDHHRRRRRPLARLQGHRPGGPARRDGAAPGRAGRPSTAAPSGRKSLGTLLKSITTTVVFGIAFVMVLSEVGMNVAPILASAGVLGPGDRLRRPEPGQGLPVRRDDDDRGPVRRRRRRRPRRGDRHGRERRPARHPGPRRRRHRLVRPQRRDPACRQPEPELGAHRARHRRRLRRGPGPRARGAHRRSPTACGRTRTTRTSSSRSPRCGACRTSLPTPSWCG